MIKVMKRIFSLLFVLVGLMAHSYAQTDLVIQKIIQIGTVENQTMKHLDVLCNQIGAVSYTHLRAHETVLELVCRLLLEKKNKP